MALNAFAALMAAQKDPKRAAQQAALQAQPQPVQPMARPALGSMAADRQRLQAQAEADAQAAARPVQRDQPVTLGYAGAAQAAPYQPVARAALQEHQARQGQAALMQQAQGIP